MEYPPRDLQTTGNVRPLLTWVERDGKNTRGPQDRRDGLPVWEVEVSFTVSSFGNDETRTGWAKFASAAEPMVERNAPPPFECVFLDNATKVWIEAKAPTLRAAK